MNDDERFDRWLASAAQEYNRPSADVPRAEMWAEIERSLDAAPVPDNVRTLPLRPSCTSSAEGPRWNRPVGR